MCLNAGTDRTLDSFDAATPSVIAAMLLQHVLVHQHDALQRFAHGCLKQSCAAASVRAAVGDAIQLQRRSADAAQ
jgi:hypothetical protein